MGKLTRDEFMDKLNEMDATRPDCIAWVGRMRDALVLSTAPDRAAEFDTQVEFLRHRQTARPQETIIEFREVVAGLLEDGYGTLYADVLPDEPSFAANVFA